MPSMQKRIAIVTILVIIAVGTFVFLQPDPGPCRKIRATCEAQGFRRGRTSAERRAFQENCFKPLLDGQSVHEVKIDEDLATACKQRQNKRRNRKSGGDGKENHEERYEKEESSSESGDEA
jgi:hypothetical protein